MTNAVIHKATPFTLDVVVDPADRQLRVAVTDFSARPVLSPIASLGLRSLLLEPTWTPSPAGD